MTDAPGEALVLERDLFFVAKIRETLTSAGGAARTVKTVDDLRVRLAGDVLPAIVLVHFGVPQVAWEEAITAAVAAGLPVLAYGAHVDIAAQQAARTAGATRVITNSKLAGDLLGQIAQTIARLPAKPEDGDDG